MMSSKLENLNRLEPKLLGFRKWKLLLLSPEAEVKEAKLETLPPGVTVVAAAATAGTAVVCVMGTNPNSNLGLSQLFSVDEKTVWNWFVPVVFVVWPAVIWVVDLVVTMNRGPGRPPRGLTARPGPPDGCWIDLVLLLLTFFESVGATSDFFFCFCLSICVKV